MMAFLYRSLHRHPTAKVAALVMGFGAEAVVQLILEAVLVCTCFEYGYEVWSSLTPVCEAYYQVGLLSGSPIH
jgi:hypothetical protein